MPRSIRSYSLLSVLVAAAGLACASAGTDPGLDCPTGVICDAVTSPTIVPLNLAPGSIPRTSVTFWAVKGQDRSGAIQFLEADGEDGEEPELEDLVSLEVGANSLLTAPDGRPYQIGDSVAITISLVNADQLLFDFQPSGLRFNPADPAELEIEYGDATGGDLNGDGVVNAADAAILSQLAIWLQELPANPFFRLESSFTDTVLEEVEADVFGFTRFAIAY